MYLSKTQIAAINQRDAELAALQPIAYAAIREHYQAARTELSRSGMCGKKLDYKARRLALCMGAITLPDDRTLSWATPLNWSAGGYRSTALDKKTA